jgi:hypothetical protein
MIIIGVHGGPHRPAKIRTQIRSGVLDCLRAGRGSGGKIFIIGRGASCGPGTRTREQWEYRGTALRAQRGGSSLICGRTLSLIDVTCRAIA